MLKLVLIFIFAVTIQAQSQSDMNNIYNNIEINFYKNQNKADVIAFINNSLMNNGDFGVYGDLREGISKLAENFKIKLTEYIQYWVMEIYPIESIGGHDFTFKISKSNGDIYDFVVGEVLPEDDLDD